MQEEVVAAKWMVQKYEWKVFYEQKQHTKKKGKKKKGRGKPSGLRGPPFNLRDGDIIAVKLLSEDREGDVCIFCFEDGEWKGFFFFFFFESGIHFHK